MTLTRYQFIPKIRQERMMKRADMTRDYGLFRQWYKRKYGPKRACTYFGEYLRWRHISTHGYNRTVINVGYHATVVHGPIGVLPL